MGVERLEAVRREFTAALEAAGGDPEAVEQVRIRFAGKRSGLLNDLTAALRELPPEERREYGRALNELKRFVGERLDAAREAAAAGAEAAHAVDVTLPGRRPPPASHPPPPPLFRRI